MLHKWKMNHLKFPFCPSLCRPRPQRCGSSPSWTSLTPWASSTARPTCRPSLLPEETSMLPLRDCWAHSPLKDIQYNLTHTLIRTYMSDSSTHSLIHREIEVYPPKLYSRISGSLRRGLNSFSILRLFFSSPYFPFFPSPEQISVLECCRRAGLKPPSPCCECSGADTGVWMPGCVFNLWFLHIKVVWDRKTNRKKCRIHVKWLAVGYFTKQFVSI